MFFRGDSVQYLIKPNTFRVAGEELLKKCEHNPKFIFEVTAKLEYALEALIAFSDEIQLSNLGEKNNDELAAMYSDWSSLIITMMAYGAVAPVMEWEESLVSNKLNAILRSKVAEPEKVGEYFNTLTSSIKDLWISKEQRDMYRLAVQGACGKEVNLQDHIRDYHWVYFNYEGPVKGDVFFRGMLRGILESKTAPSQSVIMLDRRASALKVQQNQLFHELNLREEDIHLFKVAQELSYQKGWRRDLCFKAYWQMVGLLEEIAKRTGLSLDLIRCIAPHEMRDVLINGKINKDLFESRLKFCAIMVEGGKFTYLNENESKKLAEEVDRDLCVDVTVREFRGNTAYPGHAHGKVRIIQSQKDLAKMQAGDILVSSATNPDLVPAMKMAAAIITDEGGITCHAAIVSREMRIPCVIGTRVATRVLRDGDSVDVNASTGLITLLESYK